MREFKDYETPKKLPAGTPETMQKLALNHNHEYEVRRFSVATAQADAPELRHEPIQPKIIADNEAASVP